ncbi:MAG: hypothetical protein HY320_15545 [Armatimonadetes bacterium]|nr:hypothetical protein [Armatimonadota bacterium]
MIPEHSILRLRPTYVRRFYVDGGRLGLGEKPGDTYQPQSGLWVSERWIASTVAAANPHPIEGEGLSYLADEQTTLREAIERAPERLLGPDIVAAHGAEWRVLVKVLDPWEPIVFHWHARDQDVQTYPKFFPGHRFGKDEAYYFLERPKATVPYTHAGIWPGVTREELIKAVRKGRDYALELSPAFYQRYEEGFFLPAGVPHRPGSALTLEVQQPSDVYTLLEREAGGKPLSPQQMHPGFPDLDSAFALIDMETAQQPDFLECYRLVPRRIEETSERGYGEECWIFPPEMTRKFSGKRVRVTSAIEVREPRPHAVFVWEGEGTFADVPVRAGDELFVGYEAATRPHRIRNTGNGRLELFKFFPQQPA